MYKPDCTIVFRLSPSVQVYAVLPFFGKLLILFFNANSNNKIIPAKHPNSLFTGRVTGSILCVDSLGRFSRSILWVDSLGRISGSILWIASLGRFTRSILWRRFTGSILWSRFSGVDSLGRLTGVDSLSRFTGAIIWGRFRRSVGRSRGRSFDRSRSSGVERPFVRQGSLRHKWNFLPARCFDRGRSGTYPTKARQDWRDPPGNYSYPFFLPLLEPLHRTAVREKTFAARYCIKLH